MNRSPSQTSCVMPSYKEPIPDDPEVLVEPVPFQPVIREGEPDWDEGPENGIGRSTVLQSVKPPLRMRSQSLSQSQVLRLCRWVLRIVLVIFVRG